MVRDDITAAQVVKSGEPGGSPEIYEKINPKTGRGCVVIFASAHGSYQYITQHPVVKNFWATGGVAVKRDAKGRAVMDVAFTGPDAKIIFFGTD
jgi:hypothetical protein